MKFVNYLIALGLSLLFTTTTQAQELPQPSPSAKVEQRIGLTDVTVQYSRPSAKGREIWGELVPYDEVWRVGANLNTLITFSDDVKIEGESLPEGTYSLFIKPTKEVWYVMFNTVIDGWGTGKYKEENDKLILKVTPKEGVNQESMQFSFDNLEGVNGDLILAWQKLSISMKITVDVEKKAWENVDKALAEITDENKASVYRNAAKYAVTTNKRLDEAKKWIDESIKAKESWYSYFVRADVLHANGDNKGAIASAKKAIELGEVDAKKDGKPFGYKGNIEKAMATYK
jgi:hypothetical protein